MSQEFQATYSKRDGRYVGSTYTETDIVWASGKTLKETKEKLKAALILALKKAPQNKIRGKSHLKELITI